MNIRYILAILLCIASLPATANNRLDIVYTISHDRGGAIAKYIRKALLLEASRTAVRFDGHCYSACTVFMSDAFDYDKCMTSSAVFGFHKPYLDGGAKYEEDHLVLENMTNAMWNSYPIEVRQYLETNGWPSVVEGDEPDKLTYMSAADLEGIIPYCK